jgi:hypothetical protein
MLRMLPTITKAMNRFSTFVDVKKSPSAFTAGAGIQPRKAR